jgi:ADP-ribose pyrophosphatase YjhB (NUDIX family)
MANVQSKFCHSCGGPLQYRIPALDNRVRPTCLHCGLTIYNGPDVLVSVMVIADDQLLLIQRGQQPYINKWSPPGGFVESGESLEQAARREVQEETGIDLSRVQMQPHGTISLPEINQVYATYFALLKEPMPLRPAPPETLDARWFNETTFPIGELWDPARNFAVAHFFECVRTRQWLDAIASLCLRSRSVGSTAKNAFSFSHNAM